MKLASLFVSISVHPIYLAFNPNFECFAKVNAFTQGGMIEKEMQLFFLCEISIYLR